VSERASHRARIWIGADSSIDGYDPILKSRANVNVVVASPPTYQNYDNYLLPSLQAAYDFSAEKSRIKAVIFSNPHNPLSTCYPKKALVECMEFCQERGLHLISDEIFALTPLNNSSKRGIPFVSTLSLTEPLVPEGAVKIDPSHIHVVWSASKLFGLSGLRVVSGMAYMSNDLLTVCRAASFPNRTQNSSPQCPSSQ
jgi:aspartate/methionine/tyrosine aminotransferase